jgi:hypothetical protein
MGRCRSCLHCHLFSAFFYRAKGTYPMQSCQRTQHEALYLAIDAEIALLPRELDDRLQRLDRLPRIPHDLSLHQHPPLPRDPVVRAHVELCRRTGQTQQQFQLVSEDRKCLR